MAPTSLLQVATVLLWAAAVASASCTNAPNCAALFRLPCSAVPDTCGACIAGYRLSSGDSSVPANTACIPTACGLPQPVANAYPDPAKAATALAVGDTVVYFCNTGYGTPDGSNRYVRTCSASGSLANPAAVCSRKSED